MIESYRPQASVRPAGMPSAIAELSERLDAAVRKLEFREASLASREAALRDREQALEADEARLRAWEARLAEERELLDRYRAALCDFIESLQGALGAVRIAANAAPPERINTP